MTNNSKQSIGWPQCQGFRQRVAYARKNRLLTTTDLKISSGLLLPWRYLVSVLYRYGVDHFIKAPESIISREIQAGGFVIESIRAYRDDPSRLRAGFPISPTTLRDFMTNIMAAVDCPVTTTLPHGSIDCHSNEKKPKSH